MSRNRTSPFLWLAAAWLLAAFVILSISVFRGVFWPDWLGAIYAAATLTLSPISIAFFWWDKRTAQANASTDRNDSRIPEKTLHGLALAGGWPGAIMGQQYFRHKSKKASFRIVLAFVAGIHVIAVGLYLWLLFGQ